ncbi:MAG: DUF7408 domain-containing protein [Actinomycetota bacterium]
MIHTQPRSLTWLCAASVLLAAALAALAPRAADAQTTLTTEAGLGGYYKSQRWLPINVRLTHQGGPVKVETRARFTQGLRAHTECRIPSHEVRSGASEERTLYIRTPMSYSSQPLTLELYRDGRLLNQQTPHLTLVNDGDWLALGIGGGDSTLKLLTTLTLPAGSAAPSATPWSRNQQPKVNVGIQSPARTPDQWQGLQAADMVVLGEVTERDLSPEQAGAIRDYVAAGGMLVVSGGANWNRLTTPFFKELLPAEVTGGATLTSSNGLRRLTSERGPSGRFATAMAKPKAGATVLASENGVPLAVAGRFGSGTVKLLTFDPSAAPFRNWNGVAGLWKSLLLKERQDGLVQTIANTDDTTQFGYGRYSGAPTRLADAPFAIPQLDIPAFYVVALFLLAYIVVLVPVNYFVLKARDKKEYAWLTTPAIVLVFSFGAYLIGYGFKGGRTLVVKAGLIEAYAGQSAAPNVFYAGLFSPRKTAYDIRLTSTTPAGAGPAALFSQPGAEESSPPFKSVQQEGQYVSEFAVDMWAMRVLKAEGITRLGSGVTGKVVEQGKKITGSVRNGSSLDLDDCYVVTSTSITPVGALAAGQEAALEGTSTVTQSGGGALPADLLKKIRGSKEEVRIKRAVLQPLCASRAPNPVAAANSPVLVGWVKGQAAPLEINGREPRELAATLMLVHLN